MGALEEDGTLPLIGQSFDLHTPQSKTSWWKQLVFGHQSGAVGRPHWLGEEKRDIAHYCCMHIDPVDARTAWQKVIDNHSRIEAQWRPKFLSAHPSRQQRMLDSTDPFNTQRPVQAERVLYRPIESTAGGVIVKADVTTDTLIITAPEPMQTA